jgi:hypothetical protein
MDFSSSIHYFTACAVRRICNCYAPGEEYVDVVGKERSYSVDRGALNNPLSRVTDKADLGAVRKQACLQ